MLTNLWRLLWIFSCQNICEEFSAYRGVKMNTIDVSRIVYILLFIDGNVPFLTSLWQNHLWRSRGKSKDHIATESLTSTRRGSLVFTWESSAVYTTIALDRFVLSFRVKCMLLLTSTGSAAMYARALSAWKEATLTTSWRQKHLWLLIDVVRAVDPLENRRTAERLVHTSGQPGVTPLVSMLSFRMSRSVLSSWTICIQPLSPTLTTSLWE